MIRDKKESQENYRAKTKTFACLGESLPTFFTKDVNMLLRNILTVVLDSARSQRRWKRWIFESTPLASRR